MTVQNIPGMGGHYWPQQHPQVEAGFIPIATDIVLDALDEEVLLIGRVWLEGRTGTKTLSAAGSGKIHWMVGAATITFANAGTTLRVGVQDPDVASGPPAQGDGTNDVYADLVGGTDTITALTLRSTTMTSGTKDITHGQQVVVSIRLTSRAGTDLVRVRSITNAGATVTGLNSHSPCVISNLGGYASTNTMPICAFEFDDGTRGYFDGSFLTSTGALVTVQTYNSGSTPDERGNLIELPCPINVDGLYCKLNIVGSGSDFEFCLYSDPLGTPSLIEAVTVPARVIPATNSIRTYFAPFAAVRSLSANTEYAITARPTTANNIGLYEFDVPGTTFWTAHAMGDACYQVSRSDNTGAFSASTTSRVLMGLRQCGISDDAGGSGGGILMPNKRGNMQ